MRSKKFDIRQWVLITSWNPLSVWFYRWSYLRFGFADYDPTDPQNRYAHLTNYSVCKHADGFADKRDATMMDSDEYRTYLQTSEEGRAYLLQRIPRSRGSVGGSCVDPGSDIFCGAVEDGHRPTVRELPGVTVRRCGNSPSDGDAGEFPQEMRSDVGADEDQEEADDVNGAEEFDAEEFLRANMFPPVSLSSGGTRSRANSGSSSAAKSSISTGRTGGANPVEVDDETETSAKMKSRSRASSSVSDGAAPGRVLERKIQAEAVENHPLVDEEHSSSESEASPQKQKSPLEELGEQNHEAAKVSRTAEGEGATEDSEEDWLFDSVIQEQMKRICYLSLAASAERVAFGDRKNAFELVGFDFMVDTDLNVWLLECNR